MILGVRQMTRVMGKLFYIKMCINREMRRTNILSCFYAGSIVQKCCMYCSSGKENKIATFACDDMIFVVPDHYVCYVYLLLNDRRCGGQNTTPNVIKSDSDLPPRRHTDIVFAFRGSPYENSG